MAYLRNSTQGSFTIINNRILSDKRLSLKDRGLLCTLISLPDNWAFSLAGLATIIADGKSAIRATLNRLEELGYLRRYEERDSKGRFVTYFEIIINPEEDTNEELNNDNVSESICTCVRKSNTSKLKNVENAYFDENTEFEKSVSENPTRKTRHGKSDTENRTQYNKYNKINKYNKKINHINQSDRSEGDSLPNESIDEIDEIDVATAMIKDNIHYDLLLRKKPNHEHEINEIVDLMVDVCLSNSKTIRVGGEDKSTDLVKSKFEKINFMTICYVLDCLSTAYTRVKNVRNYLITTLYNAPMTESSYHRIAGDYAFSDAMIE